MDTQLLKYFIQVARCENVSQAAADLHISQPSLSAAIRRLERELGAPLFDRIGKRLYLSDYGRNFLVTAREITMLLDNSIAANSEGLAGSFSILFRTASVHVISLVEEFHRKNPNITISTYFGSYSSQEYPVSFYDFIVDFSINPIQGAVKYTLPSTQQMYIVLPATHRLAKRSVLRLRDVRNENFIFSRSSTGFEWAHQFCIDSGFTPKCTLTANDTLCKLRFLVNGCGIALISETFLDLYRSFDSLCAIPLMEIQPSTPPSFWVSKSVDFNPAAVSFLKYFRSRTPRT